MAVHSGAQRPIPVAVVPATHARCKPSAATLAYAAGWVSLAVATLALQATPVVQALSLSGPAVYVANQSIPVYFNKVFSERTRLPFEYDELPFVCSPVELSHKMLNLGEILRGDRIVQSDIAIKTLEESQCEMLCSKPLHKRDVLLARQMIRDDYHVEWILDDLPGATAKASVGGPVTEKRYDVGFPLGFHNERTGELNIYNHLLLNIIYQQAPGGILILGFEVYPKSVKHIDGQCPLNVDTGVTMPMTLPETGMTLEWSYSVRWQPDAQLKWAHRWDMYLSTNSNRVHWYSIINSIVMLLILSGAVAYILLRTLTRDITFYNSEQEVLETAGESVGWKALYGDVFRPPRFAAILVSLVSSGVQTLAAVVLTTLTAGFGLLGPQFRGGIVSVGLFLFVFCGVIAGYTTARLYRTFCGYNWRKTALVTAVMSPLIILSIVFMSNLFIWSKGSSSAIPFGTFACLIAMWLGISCPLVWLGGFFGARHKPVEFPTRSNQIPRQIPEQPWYLHTSYLIMFAGAVPFSVIFLELYFILDSALQFNHTHHLYSFLSIITLMLVLTIIETTIVVAYLTLSAEDYQWQWRSFLVGSASTVYIFVYACHYFVANLQASHPMAAMLYFAYCFIGCFLFMLATGAIGYISSLVFVFQIYGRIKVD
ncbi:hypothetical protein BC831DRAFT_551805 [Entophlyctis helioformis]|nr:hypothetical protein BC831DRAFT_551805 [Entophlyctis helioformis]